MLTQSSNKSLWISGALAAMSLILMAGLLGVISSDKKTVLNQKITLAGLTNDLNYLDTILSDKKQYSGSIDRVEQTLPKDYKDVATAVGAIEQLAKSDKITADMVIDDKSKPETGGLESLTLGLHTAGTYAEINEFLSGVSHLPYHTRVDTIQFDGTQGKLSAVINLRLYIQKYE